MNQIKKLSILEPLSYFEKNMLYSLFGNSAKALSENMNRWIRQGKVFRLKRGMYVTKAYLDRSNYRSSYEEFIANKLRFPSYLSLEYVLELHGILSESVFAYTSVTKKTPRQYKNSLGIFTYHAISENLFCDFQIIERGIYKISIASKPKALFDYLYLRFFRTKKISRDLIRSLRLNVDGFSKHEKTSFTRYCAMTGQKKFGLMPQLVFMR
jgi:hypothetical protein